VARVIEIGGFALVETQRRSDNIGADYESMQIRL